MDKQDKQVLLRYYLCEMLPYGVKCCVDDHLKGKLTVIPHSMLDMDGFECHTEEWEYEQFYSPDELKPYLRPMERMTEEEKEELKSEFCVEIREEDNGRHTETYGYCIVYHKFKGESWYIPFEAIDWLNAHHFDYRGLIDMGLALEAPEGMYD